MSNDIRLLIGAGKNKLAYVEKFSEALQRHNINCKLVIDVEVCNGFPSKDAGQWIRPYHRFNELVKQYKPDAVFVDRQVHFGLAAIKNRLPLFVQLRGDYWSELKWAKETTRLSLKSHFIFWLRNKITEKCLNDATMILPFSEYLSNIVKSHYPDKPTMVFQDGIDLQYWHRTEGLDLKHPCVGLLQNASIWGKTKEMLTLTKVLEALPHVTFYWAGDGIYKDKILSVLGKYKNFKWLGKLSYPDQVRRFLSSIDVYALLTGYDTFGMTIVEAEIMKVPVIATNVGGTPEAMIENKTGFLVSQGNHKELIEKITTLLNDQRLSKNMSESGHAFASENFDWEKTTERFIKNLKTMI